MDSKSSSLHFLLSRILLLIFLTTLGEPWGNGGPCGEATIIIRPDRPDGSPWGPNGTHPFQRRRPHHSTTPSDHSHTNSSSTQRPHFPPQFPQFPQFPQGGTPHVNWIPLGAFLFGGGRGAGSP